MLTLREVRELGDDFGSLLFSMLGSGRSLTEAIVVRRVLADEERELLSLSEAGKAGAFCFLSLSCIWLEFLSLGRDR